MSDFTITVVDCPAKSLVGMKVRTTMQKAQADCPALWQEFGPRIDALCPGGGCTGAYGLSAMINETEFYYWAAVEAEAFAEVPAGLERADLPAGRYAACPVPNLEKLAEAYTHLYTTWLPSAPGYVINEQAPCFELYPSNWQLSDAFALYMPVRER